VNNEEGRRKGRRKKGRRKEEERGRTWNDADYCADLSAGTVRSPIATWVETLWLAKTIAATTTRDRATGISRRGPSAFADAAADKSGPPRHESVTG